MQVPPWEALAEGLRSERVDVERKPRQPNQGWQKFASTTVQHVHRESVVWPTLSRGGQAMVRSQSGTRFGPVHSDAHEQRHTNRSRAHPSVVVATPPFPSASCAHSCRCGRLHDVLGHHWAACSTGGALGRSRVAAESAVAQICRENAMLRDLDIVPLQTNGRLLQVVAEG